MTRTGPVVAEIQNDKRGFPRNVWNTLQDGINRIHCMRISSQPELFVHQHLEANHLNC